MNKATFSRSLTFLLMLFLALLGVFAALSSSGADSSLAQTLPTRTPTPSNYLPVILNEYTSAFLPQVGAPSYTAYADGSGKCSGSGIAGVVHDLSGQPVADGRFRVHVWGSGVDARVPVGSAPEVGPSGWELTLSNSLVSADYHLQLEQADGTLVSPVVKVESRADCGQNLIRFDFVQVYEVE